MKIKREEIQKIAKLVFEHLQKNSLVEIRSSATPDQVISKIDDIIHANFEQEAAIEEEVKKLMDQYRAQIASGAIDPQKMYTMMKKQVAKERKFTL